MPCNGHRYRPMLTRNGEIGGMTGSMTGKMRGIRGRRAARQPERRSRNARKPTIREIENVARTSDMRKTMHATLPGTSSETNDDRWTSPIEPKNTGSS